MFCVARIAGGTDVALEAFDSLFRLFCRCIFASSTAVVAPSLLITDDDRDFRETLRDMFEPRGFHLLTAGDGEEAVEILRHETVNVALFDMHMPRLNGLDAIRRLREFRLPPTWILLSAEADEQLIAEAREAQVFDVLRKPVTRDRVIDVVQQALDVSFGTPNWRGLLGS